MSWRVRISLIILTLFAVGAVALSSSNDLTREATPASVASFLPAPAKTVSTSTIPATIATSTSSPVATSTPVTELAAAGASEAASVSADSTPANLTGAGSTLLHSLVNILCIPKSGGGIPGGSGSGVIIDSRGLIITAAHIGQYFLLQDYPKPNSVTCTIRTGGPASNAYTAQLVYISPTWVNENADVLKEKNPTGTGENDFAILAITGSAGEPLPSSFNYVPLSNDAPSIGEKVAIAGYSAEYLGSSDVEHNLYPTVSFTPISNEYTFTDNNTDDVISINGTPAAQEGSSGGGVADANGTLVGMVTTSQVSGDIQSHVLNAITPLHIRASFEADMGKNFDSYLSSNSLPGLITLFQPEAAKLTQVLAKTLFQ